MEKEMRKEKGMKRGRREGREGGGKEGAGRREKREEGKSIILVWNAKCSHKMATPKRCESCSLF